MVDSFSCITLLNRGRLQKDVYKARNKHSPTLLKKSEIHMGVCSSKTFVISYGIYLSLPKPLSYFGILKTGFLLWFAFNRKQWVVKRWQIELSQFKNV